MNGPDDTRLDDLIRRHHGAAEAREYPPDDAARALLAEWQWQDAAILSALPDPGDGIPARFRRLLDQAPAPRLALRPAVAAVAAAVLFGLGAGAGWLARPALSPAPEPLALAAVEAHRVYTAEIAHPVEVTAADEAHLVRWLSKRLGQTIHAPDLSARGFRLMGGRLLPGGSGPAAQFMYEDDAGKRLTLYLTPEAGAPGETAFRHVEADGQQGFWWIDEGLGCAIIGPVGRDEMRAIAIAAYEQVI